MNNLIQRSFTVGDNWLYYKIYTGSRTSDMILLDIIKPLTESLLNDDVIDKWFFIRYNDPDAHIRLRFLLSENSSLAQVVSTFTYTF